MLLLVFSMIAATIVHSDEDISPNLRILSLVNPMDIKLQGLPHIYL